MYRKVIIYSIIVVGFFKCKMKKCDCSVHRLEDYFGNNLDYYNSFKITRGPLLQPATVYGVGKYARQPCALRIEIQYTRVTPDREN
jgi:hypothetical protein